MARKSVERREKACEEFERVQERCVERCLDESLVATAAEAGEENSREGESGGREERSKEETAPAAAAAEYNARGEAELKRSHATQAKSREAWRQEDCGLAARL